MGVCVRVQCVLCERECAFCVCISVHECGGACMMLTLLCTTVCCKLGRILYDSLFVSCASGYRRN